MSIDVVTYLRNLASPDPYDERPTPHAKELYQAADEIETLRKQLRTEKDSHLSTGHTVGAKAQSLFLELAASQAREQQLREALTNVRSADLGDYDCQVIDEALALPQDDTALRQYMESAQHNPWKAAIIGANITHWSFKKEHETDPRKALNDLLCISNQMALDPQISEDADKLCREYGAKLLREMAEKGSYQEDMLIARLRRKADELEGKK